MFESENLSNRFQWVEEDENEITYCFIDEFRFFFNIVFDKKYKYYRIEGNGYNEIDIEFHNAITQQMKELGWIE